MNNHFALHFRITKQCNADCDYCSSAGKAHLKRISVEDFKRSVDYLSNEVLPEILEPNDSFLTINYVGGEVLTFPYNELKEIVEYARCVFGEQFLSVKDGTQSNLLGNSNRLNKIKNLFNGNIGTSVDTTTDKRKFKGSSSLYKAVFDKNIGKVFSGVHPPSVYVVDSESDDLLRQEYQNAEQKNFNLVIRPVFQGSKKEVLKNNDTVTKKILEVFDLWFMSSSIIVEPFYTLLKKKLTNLTMDSINYHSSFGCPFQSNCTQTSMNLDPDGKLSLCVEMSDMGIYEFGNAIKGELNLAVISELKDRTLKMPIECMTCKHFFECQGGCMAASYNKNGSIYSKTEYCDLWYGVLDKIEDYIHENGSELVRQWVYSLDFA